MKTYICSHDERHVAHCHVQTAGKAYLLDARLDLMNHSASGFSWGYRGSGPAQLALAILSDHFAGDRHPTPVTDALAICLYQRFKEDVISHMPEHGFTIISSQIRAALSVVAEAHGEPLTLSLTEAIMRRARQPGRVSLALLRAQFLALLIGSVGCTPRLAGKIIDNALCSTDSAAVTHN